MPDLIKLLPDSVANQIAAGEVVQRPASAVKELLENAVDSGADAITLIIRDAGKSLLQVLDNGCGMSERDARMCFERHATSKIHSADDLFSIRTLGFRGEALASIASVAQVEMKTRRTGDDIGTCVVIEGTQVKEQYPVTCQDGTSVAVKNLFFNVPARRNFLKSNTLELKYIIDEFFRVALVHCETAFTLINNDKVIYKLAASTLKQRIVALFGNSYGQRLVPVEQSTAIVNLSGFIGKPEFARKVRGEQYFFANHRFIKSPYLHHAIEDAFKELLPKDVFPSYFIYLDVDPKMLDVNIHPTKTEINFLDGKSIYAILFSSVRQSIGRFNISSSFDFEHDKSFDLPASELERPVKPPTITIDPTYNPFEKKVMPQFEIPLKARQLPVEPQLERLYDPLKDLSFRNPVNFSAGSEQQEKIQDISEQAQNMILSRTFQAMNRFIITWMQSGIFVIDQQNAHERILYEKFLREDGDHHGDTQQQLLPQTLRLQPAEASLLTAFLDEFRQIGYAIESFGKNDFIISGIPEGVSNENIAGLIEKTLEQLQTSPGGPVREKRSRLAMGLSKSLAVKRGQKLEPRELALLVENLFACKVPEVTPEGKPTLYQITFDELISKFK